MLYDVNVCSAHATVFDGDVSKTKRDAPVEFRKKMIKETVQLGCVGRDSAGRRR